MGSDASLKVTLTAAQLHALLGYDQAIVHPTTWRASDQPLEDDSPLAGAFWSSPLADHGCKPTVSAFPTPHDPATDSESTETYRVGVNSRILSRSITKGLSMPGFRDELAELVVALAGTTTADPSIQLELDDEF